MCVWRGLPMFIFLQFVAPEEAADAVPPGGSVAEGLGGWGGGNREVLLRCVPGVASRPGSVRGGKGCVTCFTCL